MGTPIAARIDHQLLKSGGGTNGLLRRVKVRDEARERIVSCRTRARSFACRIPFVVRRMTA